MQGNAVSHFTVLKEHRNVVAEQQPVRYVKRPYNIRECLAIVKSVIRVIDTMLPTSEVTARGKRDMSSHEEV